MYQLEIRNYQGRGMCQAVRACLFSSQVTLSFHDGVDVTKIVSPMKKPSSGTSRKRTPGAFSLAHKAYQEIRDKILKGEFPVGIVLSRRKIATELQMSFPPVSEAFQQLESEGLLESKPRVGTRVRIPTKQDVRDRAIIREALETQAARLFAERAGIREKQKLLRMGKHLDKLYARCEIETVNRNFLFSVNTYHMDLHLRIAEGARCPVLRDAIEREQVLIFNWLYDTVAQRRTLSSNFHARLTAALATGKPAAAAAAMRRHIRFGLREVLSKINRLGQSENGWRLKKAKKMENLHTQVVDYQWRRRGSNPKEAMRDLA
jgi:DNA-binding GntR family transcriptional regulator